MPQHPFTLANQDNPYTMAAFIIEVLEKLREMIGDDYENELQGDESTRSFLDALDRILDTHDLDTSLDEAVRGFITS